MNETIKPVIALLQKRQANKIEALKAYDAIITDPQVKQMREIEAIKLRHEVDVLNDLMDFVTAIYPNA